MAQDRIVTARDVLRVNDAAAYHERIVGEQRRDRSRGWRALSAGLDVANIDAARAARSPLAPAVAYVNHGRWVADCPASGCGGAMLLLDGADFLCGTCFNVDAVGRPRAVSWPSDRAAIEAVLRVRPLPTQMNWRPGEKVESLAVENAILMGGE